MADSAQLDFETIPAYGLTVTVTDSGGLTDDAAVTINLTDVNEAPNMNNQGFVELENAPNGTIVATLGASDPDVGDTRTFTILSGNESGAFALNGTTGKITVADSTQLDYETTPTFTLIVEVRDAGGLTDTATVTINLEDVNEVPTATGGEFSLAENSADGTVVGSASASDPDAGDSLTYAITSGDPGNAFGIDSATGEITVNDSAQLDFETTPVFNLTVTVTDSGGLTDDAAVTVKLANLNEDPTASDAAFSLAESSGDGVVVGNVSASDPDAGDSLSYAITGGDPTGVFAIDSATGEITVVDSSQLDFETTSVYGLTVTVTDSGGLTDDAAVTVNLTDVNEAPTVSLQNAISLVSENIDTSARIKVADIVVADDALGTNVLSLSGADAGLFEVDGAELYLKAGVSLDFETNPVLDVTVEVDDASLPATPEDSTALAITVANVNEAPSASDAIFGLAENSANGTVVGSVSASDPDAGDSLSYAIIGWRSDRRLRHRLGDRRDHGGGWLAARLRDHAGLRPDGHGDGFGWSNG